MGDLSEIQKFYKGKTIFITGGSGLMGKVLIEKLLFSCSELDKIYILIRPKKGRTPEVRIEEMFKLPMFKRIQKVKPQVLKKLVYFTGDITMDKLGITEEQTRHLENEVDIVYHCAATLRLEANLRDAIHMNAIGTKRVLELSKRMKKLKCFVHLSTAFCHVDQDKLEERFYDSADDPENVIKLVEWLKDDALDIITPKLIDPHPNTYTYSKRLAETLVSKEYKNFPRSAIARPSIVTPAWMEPVPGWVDNLNGPMGLTVGAGKGVIRSMHCKAEYRAELIPVDIAINALIGIAYKITVAPEKPKEIPVYNITQSGVVPLTWGEILEKGKRVAREYPFDGAIWYPDGDIRRSRFIHNLFVFFFHIIPAYFIDFLMLIFRQKRFMVRIQKRISEGLEVLQYFTTKSWFFHNKNLLTLYDEMSPKDKQLFPIDFLAIDENEYLRHCILGARQFCMKEPLSTLPRARLHHKMLYVIHIVCVYGFYFGILYMIFKNFETARVCLDYASDTVKSLPLVRQFTRKI